jgi:hypothetical protein
MVAAKYYLLSCMMMTSLTPDRAEQIQMQSLNTFLLYDSFSENKYCCLHFQFKIWILHVIDGSKP